MEQLTSEDWAVMMPEVAKALKGEPVAEQAGVWFYPGRASGRAQSRSFHVDVGGKKPGTWRDWSAEQGGGVLQLVEYELQTDRKGALAWLRERGVIAATEQGRAPLRWRSGRSGQRAAPQRDRASAQREAQQKAEREREVARERESKTAYARRLWNEARPIAGANHPARLWASKFNVLHPWVSFPPALRWHAKQGAIVAAIVPLAAWCAEWPSIGDVCAVHLVAIDQQGEKRMAFAEGTLDKKNHAPASGGVVALGSPTAKRAVLVEGIKDALAAYSHLAEPHAVLAMITTVRGAVNRPGLVDYLDLRDVLIWTDTDAPKTDPKGITRAAGQSAGYALQAALAGCGIVSRVQLSDAEGTDPGDWARAQEWPAIDRGAFDEAAANLREEWPGCEAARRAVHASSKCTIAPPVGELSAAEIEAHIRQRRAT